MYLYIYDDNNNNDAIAIDTGVRRRLLYRKLNVPLSII
jgi:hypothetical protein